MALYQLEVVTPLGTVLSKPTEDKTAIETQISTLPDVTTIHILTQEGHTFHMTKGMADQSVFFIRTVE